MDAALGAQLHALRTAPTAAVSLGKGFTVVCADLDAAQAILGERPYFGGAAPTALDASVYAFLANTWIILLCSVPCVAA